MPSTGVQHARWHAKPSAQGFFRGTHAAFCQFTQQVQPAFARFWQIFQGTQGFVLVSGNTIPVRGQNNPGILAMNLPVEGSLLL